MPKTLFHNPKLKELLRNNEKHVEIIENDDVFYVTCNSGEHHVLNSDGERLEKETYSLILEHGKEMLGILTGKTHSVQDGDRALLFQEFKDYGWLGVHKENLYFIGEYSDGTFDEYGEVTAPESQGILDAVNMVYGTEFHISQFAGR